MAQKGEQVLIKARHLSQNKTKFLLAEEIGQGNEMILRKISQGNELRKQTGSAP